MTSMRKTNGIPSKRTVIHRFSTNEGSNSHGTTDVTVGFAVAANSLENPSAFGTIINNAMLFDQLSAIYERYTVKKATIRVDFFNESTTEGMIVGISLKDDVDVLTSTGHYAELGDTVYKTLTPKEHSTLVFTADPVKYFGTKKSNAMADDRLSTGTGGDSRPADALFFHLWSAPIDGTGAGTSPVVQMYYTVEYEATWNHPIELARSVAT